jgi:hypothetical protein
MQLALCYIGSTKKSPEQTLHKYLQYIVLLVSSSVHHVVIRSCRVLKCFMFWVAFNGMIFIPNFVKISQLY